MKKNVILILSLILILSGCSKQDGEKSTSNVNTSQLESSITSESEKSSQIDNNRDLSDYTIDEMRKADIKTHFGDAEPEMELDNVIWYKNNQKVFFRDILLENGEKRHLNGILLTNENWINSFFVAIADSNSDNYVYLPTWTAEISKLDYKIDEESENVTPEITKIEWMNKDYFFIASSANVGIFEGSTGELVSISKDPWEILSKAEGLDRAYISPVNEVYSLSNSVYYTGYRDPLVLNNNGKLFELSLLGEKLLTDDALYTVGTYEGFVVFIRSIPGKDDYTPFTQGLCVYDLSKEKVIEVFTDTYYNIDKDYNIIGGVNLGNEWLDKQWDYNNPNYIIKDGALYFYASNIDNKKLTQYVYNFSKQTLEDKGFISPT